MTKQVYLSIIANGRSPEPSNDFPGGKIVNINVSVHEGGQETSKLSLYLNPEPNFVYPATVKKLTDLLPDVPDIKAFLQSKPTFPQVADVIAALLKNADLNVPDMRTLEFLQKEFHNCLHTGQLDLANHTSSVNVDKAQSAAFQPRAEVTAYFANAQPFAPKPSQLTLSQVRPGGKNTRLEGQFGTLFKSGDADLTQPVLNAEDYPGSTLLKEGILSEYDNDGFPTSVRTLDPKGEGVMYKKSTFRLGTLCVAAYSPTQPSRSLSLQAPTTLKYDKKLHITLNDFEYRNKNNTRPNNIRVTNEPAFEAVAKLPDTILEQLGLLNFSKEQIQNQGMHLSHGHARQMYPANGNPDTYENITASSGAFNMEMMAWEQQAFSIAKHNYLLFKEGTCPEDFGVNVHVKTDVFRGTNVMASMTYEVTDPRTKQSMKFHHDQPLKADPSISDARRINAMAETTFKDDKTLQSIPFIKNPKRVQDTGTQPPNKRTKLGQ